MIMRREKAYRRTDLDDPIAADIAKNEDEEENQEEQDDQGGEETGFAEEEPVRGLSSRLRHRPPPTPPPLARHRPETVVLAQPAQLRQLMSDPIALPDITRALQAELGTGSYTSLFDELETLAASDVEAFRARIAEVIGSLANTTNANADLTYVLIRYAAATVQGAGRGTILADLVADLGRRLPDPQTQQTVQALMMLGAQSFPLKQRHRAHAQAAWGNDWFATMHTAAADDPKRGPGDLGGPTLKCLAISAQQRWSLKAALPLWLHRRAQRRSVPYRREHRLGGSTTPGWQPYDFQDTQGPAPAETLGSTAVDPVVIQDDDPLPLLQIGWKIPRPSQAKPIPPPGQSTEKRKREEGEEGRVTTEVRKQKMKQPNLDFTPINQRLLSNLLVDFVEEEGETEVEEEEEGKQEGEGDVDEEEVVDSDEAAEEPDDPEGEEVVGKEKVAAKAGTTWSGRALGARAATRSNSSSNLHPPSSCPGILIRERLVAIQDALQLETLPTDQGPQVPKLTQLRCCRECLKPIRLTLDALLLALQDGLPQTAKVTHIIS